MTLSKSLAIVAVLVLCSVTSPNPATSADPPVEETLPAGAVARLGAHWFVHQDRIRSLTFLPDGSALFAASSDQACLWDVATGQKRQAWRLESSVMCGALSQDGRTAVLAENGRQLHVFNTLTGKQTAQLADAMNRSHAVSISPDGLRIASGDGGEVVLWDAANAKELRRWRESGTYIKALRFSPDGQRLAIADSGGRMWVRSVDGGEPPVQLDGGSGFSAWLVFSPDGKTLAGSCEVPISGGHRSSLRFWDSTTGRALRIVPGSFNHGAFSPNGKWLAACGLEKVTVYDTATGKELHRLPDCHQHIWSVAFSPDGKTLATGQGQRIRLWNTDTWQEINPGSGHSEPVQAIAFSPDGRTIATGGLDGRLIQWAWPEAEERRRIEGIGSHWGVQHVTFSPDGRTLAVTAWINWDDMFFLFDAATSAPTSRFGKNHQGRSPVAFLPGGTEVLTGQGDGSLAVWDVASGKLVRTVGDHDGGIDALRPMPDARMVWWAGEYQGLGLRDLTTGEDVRVLNGASHHTGARLAVSPNGDWLAVGSRVWDIKTGEVIADGRDAVAAVSPDGRLLATVTGGGIAFWEALTRRDIHTLRTGTGNLNALAYSPDGTVLAAAGYADTKVWDMTGRLQNGKLPEIELTSAEMESLWLTLGGEDAWKAHQAAWALGTGGKAAVAFLSERLRPAGIPHPRRIQTLRARLAAPDYDARELAARQLLDLGIELRPEDREALRRPDPAYASRSSPGFGIQPERPPPLLPPPVLLPLTERLRSSRAVLALERNKAPEAESLLDALADGAPQAPQTSEAIVALARVRQPH